MVEKAFQDVDGALALANDPRWWADVAPVDVLGLVEYRWQEHDPADQRYSTLEQILDERTGELYGVPAADFADGAIPDSYRRSRNDAAPAVGSDRLSAYEEVVVRGIHDADARMADFGLRSTNIAYGSPVELSDEARVILGAEGAAATLRVAEKIGAVGQPTDESLLRMTWDLQANPWDSGPLRRDAVEQLSNSIGAYSDKLAAPTAERLNDVLEAEVPDERRGIHAVASRVSRDTDKEALRGRVEAAKVLQNREAPRSAETSRSASAAAFPLSAADSLRSARSAQSPAVAQRTATAGTSASVAME